MTEQTFVTRLAQAVRAGGGLAQITDRVLGDVTDPEEWGRLARILRDLARQVYGVRA